MKKILFLVVAFTLLLGAWQAAEAADGPYTWSAGNYTNATSEMPAPTGNGHEHDITGTVFEWYSDLGHYNVTLGDTRVLGTTDNNEFEIIEKDSIDGKSTPDITWFFIVAPGGSIGKKYSISGSDFSMYIQVDRNAGNGNLTFTKTPLNPGEEYPAPEPATILSLLFGAVGVAMRKRLARKK
jgi:hypothetical protein